MTGKCRFKQRSIRFSSPPSLTRWSMLTTGKFARNIDNIFHAAPHHGLLGQRLLVIDRRHQKMNPRAIVDILQEADEGFALVGFAIAPRPRAWRQTR